MDIPETAVFNDQGQVAMKYRKQRPITVNCKNPAYSYIFTVRANIPMAWIDPVHVPCMSTVKYGCCGNRKPGGVIFANEDDVRRWTNGGGR